MAAASPTKTAQSVPRTPDRGGEEEDVDVENERDDSSVSLFMNHCYSTSSVDSEAFISDDECYGKDTMY